MTSVFNEYIRVQLLIPVAVAFVVAFALTGWFRRYALRGGLMDVPNERSSHTQPTPRGGGVAIVITTLVCVPLLAALHLLDNASGHGLLAAGTIAAGIGYADDRGQVSVRFRLLFQFLAAGLALLFIGVEPVQQAIPILSTVTWLGVVLALLYLVWMLNLTNFMDGIDGIASVEVVSVCVGLVMCVLAVLVGESSVADHARALHINGIIAAALVLAASTSGFLVWNWPPARIFMGDAGSGFVGVLLGALTLMAGKVSPLLLWSGVILAGIFVVDATFTLVRRIVRGEKFYQAHRSHAYQHAALRFGHRRVTVSVGLINLLWLLPWSIAAARGVIAGPLAMICAYVPLIIVAWRFRAGLRD
ncbi:MAG: MraY family glycosyltransferase [Gemmatimonas sp.]